MMDSGLMMLYVQVMNLHCNNALIHNGEPIIVIVQIVA